MKPFYQLTKEDVEHLRDQPLSIQNGKSMDYDFTETQIDEALKHLRRLYSGRVVYPFAVKIMIANRLDA